MGEGSTFQRNCGQFQACSWVTSSFITSLRMTKTIFPYQDEWFMRIEKFKRSPVRWVTGTTACSPHFRPHRTSHIPSLVLLPPKILQKTHTHQLIYHRAKPATSTWASSLSWQRSMQGREITDSPRDSWEGTWSWWLPFLLLLQKRFRFFWAWVHFFSHSVGEKRDKPEGKKTKKNQRSSSETQKAGTRAGLLGSPLHKDHLYQLRTKELASLISLQLLSVFTEEKRKGVAN